MRKRSQLPRPIKFRGKRTNGEWAYGDFYHATNGTPCIDEWEVDAKTVGQFTGLHDSTTWDHLTRERRMDYAQHKFHGVEIYEGDIICGQRAAWGYDPDAPLIPYAFIVVWNSELCRFDWVWTSGSVAGNIHDNPELVEGGDAKQD
jgi:hypothetical protein